MPSMEIIPAPGNSSRSMMLPINLAISASKTNTNGCPWSTCSFMAPTSPFRKRADQRIRRPQFPTDRQRYRPIAVLNIETLQCFVDRGFNLGGSDALGLLKFRCDDLEVSERQQLRMRKINRVAAHLYGILRSPITVARIRTSAGLRGILPPPSLLARSRMRRPNGTPRSPRLRFRNRR